MGAHLKTGKTDRKYVLHPQNTLNGRPTWRGFTSNSIQWNNNKTQWEITDAQSKDPIFSTKMQAFPVGEGIWDLESEDICSEHPDGNKLKLMLSNCGQYEFSCSDGTCIPIEKKCDFVPNCWDRGDEIDCQLLNDENMQDYDSNIPDIVLDKRGNILKKIVKVSMTIKEIQKIAEVQSRFTATFNLRMDKCKTHLV